MPYLVQEGAVDVPLPPTLTYPTHLPSTQTSKEWPKTRLSNCSLDLANPSRRDYEIGIDDLDRYLPIPGISIASPLALIPFSGPIDDLPSPYFGAFPPTAPARPYAKGLPPLYPGDNYLSPPPFKASPSVSRPVDERCSLPLMLGYSTSQNPIQFADIAPPRPLPRNHLSPAVNPSLVDVPSSRGPVQISCSPLMPQNILPSLPRFDFESSSRQRDAVLGPPIDLQSPTGGGGETSGFHPAETPSLTGSSTGESASSELPPINRFPPSPLMNQGAIETLPSLTSKQTSGTSTPVPSALTPRSADEALLPPLESSVPTSSEEETNPAGTGHLKMEDFKPPVEFIRMEKRRLITKMDLDSFVSWDSLPITRDEDPSIFVELAVLCRIAILASPHKQLTIAGIFQALVEQYPNLKGEPKQLKDRISRYLGLHSCFVRELHDNKLSSSLVQGPKGRSKHIYAVDQSISIKVRKPAAPKKRKAGEGEALQKLSPNPIQHSSYTDVVLSGKKLRSDGEKSSTSEPSSSSSPAGNSLSGQTTARKGAVMQGLSTNPVQPTSSGGETVNRLEGSAERSGQLDEENPTSASLRFSTPDLSFLRGIHGLDVGSSSPASSSPSLHERPVAPPSSSSPPPALLISHFARSLFGS